MLIRDNRQADVICAHYGQQLAFCEPDVKDFDNITDCYSVATFKPIDKDIEPINPAHNC